ncbi:MAG: inorganic pyrophosphatase [Waddliaceae bacterium]
MSLPILPKLPKHMLFRSHPWHGLSLGNDSPDLVNCYIEMVPTDTVKYEIDKETGILKVDRPQKYSSLCPSLYGLIPQTYCGPLIAAHCMGKTGRTDVIGDRDPLDICVLTEREIPRGDIILQAYPIGGFRLLDGEEADDKIIAVLKGDFIYEGFKDVSNLPKNITNRLWHYFSTYKDTPDGTSNCISITHTYGAKEAKEIIKLSHQDYLDKFS